MLHSLQRAAGSIGLHVNADKTEYMCFNQRGDISRLKGVPQKLVDKFTYRESCVSSNEDDINTPLAKAWSANDRLSVILKSDMSDKIKRRFFQAAVVSILLYGCTTWTLTKRMKNKAWQFSQECCELHWTSSRGNHSIKQRMYGHLPPITKTIQFRRTRLAGHCRRSKEELISDILLWTPHGPVKLGQPAWTYIQQLCADTGFRLED